MALKYLSGFARSKGSPWTYGVSSPNPKDYDIDIYGEFVLVRASSQLPELNCLVVIWASVSSDKWFYQTSLGLLSGTPLW